MDMIDDNMATLKNTNVEAIYADPPTWHSTGIVVSFRGGTDNRRMGLGILKSGPYVHGRAIHILIGTPEICAILSTNRITTIQEQIKNRGKVYIKY